MSKLARHIFHGMQVLQEGRWKTNIAVVVEAGNIRSIIPADMIANHMPAVLHEYTEAHYLVPGFIDLHIHGAAGADVMDGTQEALASIACALAEEGVTGFLATTMTASSEQMDIVLRTISDFSRQSDHKGAELLGVHLEGPFIAKEKMGAQAAAYICPPDMALFETWQQLSGNLIKVVTMAPELPNAIELIKNLKRRGVIVSVGHTNATYDETLAAITAGCTQATHLFNAMRGLQQREPGAAGALLLSPVVSVELIADGLHLHPAMLELALKLKGGQGVILVTDAMRAKCCGDGHYELGGQDVTVVDGKVTIANGTLAGSTLRMPQAIKNMVSFSGCTLAEAIQMASSYPASCIGLGDKKGKIAAGFDADLVVLDADFNVELTMRGGAVIARLPRSEPTR